MKKWLKNQWVRLLPSLSALVTGLAFLDARLGFLVLIGLVPFLWYTLHSVNLSPKKIFLDCGIAGFVFALMAGSFILQTIPSNWIPLAGAASLIAKLIVWIGLAIISALSFGLIIGWATVKFRHKPVRLYVLLPLLWPAAELARSFLITLFVYGPGGSLEPNWTQGTLGLGVAATPLAYLSRFVGLHGLTVVAVITNIALYLTLRKRYAPAFGIALTILVLTTLAWRLYLPNHNLALRVAAYNLEAAKASDTDWTNIKHPARDTDLVVLPEYSNFFTHPSNKTISTEYFEDATVLVTSEGGALTMSSTNDLVAYSGNGTQKSRQPKTLLAPFGEYLPYAMSLALKHTGQQSTLDRFKDNSQILRGSQPEQPIRSDAFVVGSLVCSGTFNLSEYRRLARQGADILTNSASLALMKEASLYRVQEYYQNRLHAVANAKPFVQSTRSGISYVISSDGEVLVSTDRQGAIETTVYLQPKRTIYSLL